MTCRGIEVLQAPYSVDVFLPNSLKLWVSAQIGSRVVRGGPEVRFHEGSTVPPAFHEVLACCWGYHLSLFYLFLFAGGGGGPKYSDTPLNESLSGAAFEVTKDTAMSCTNGELSRTLQERSFHSLSTVIRRLVR